ncbi:hypothetical protein Sinac_4091 [Singulisphaera acidiphila DSM 18658]|uniref:Uncharacterized protein n=1 Tax=Singulisphaera acidiphila (strain ATCC BAA-1392 / DSM 18658 / VKM B-2454 / MOB10) TaxID=886293 RepID=L0DI00_SINAD|nr:hypothetical protein Sinac_4091 [Singulisphaera acidiphila DSM 18658]
MRLPRFQLRTLMVAVAIVALIAWAGRMMRLSAVYQRRADTYQMYLFRIESPGVRGGWRPPPTEHDRWANHMTNKYRNAARYPWLVVTPDPPEPAHFQRFPATPYPRPSLGFPSSRSKED